MKNIFVVMLAPWLLVHIPSVAQLCTVVRTSNPTFRDGAITNREEFVPNANTPVKILKVNIHFIRLDNGTGNFNENNDGNGNANYNGYLFARDIVNAANHNISNAPAPSFPNWPALAKLPFAFRYVLEGVYFHNSTQNYNSFNPIALNSQFGVNRGNSINIFFTEHCIRGCVEVWPDKYPIHHGVANMNDERSIIMGRCWHRYVFEIANTGTFANAIPSVLLNHEIGHNLSLQHVLVPVDGVGCALEDFCDDTPSVLTSASGLCCNTCTYGIGNNMMSYNDGSALTPCQLGRVHWTIENELPGHKLCRFTTDLTRVQPTDLNGNQVLFHGRSVVVQDIFAPITSATILSGRVATFAARDMVGLGYWPQDFEVQEGADFEIQMIEECP